MKKLSKSLSLLLLTIVLFFSNFPVLAFDNIDSEDIKPTGLNNLSVNLAIRDYFNSRADYLLGNTAKLDWSITGIVNDEVKHHAQYVSKNIQFLGSSYNISNIVCNDVSASASILEIISYAQDGIEQTEEIPHTLSLSLDKDNTPVVVADAYIEQCTNFISCSYVAPGLQPNANPPGSGPCIVEIAKRELGTEETYDNITKYGEWFGNNGVPWCAIFICWCANQANVSTSVIPKTAGCKNMMDSFIAKGRFFYSNSYGGTYTPQAGDILFFGNTIDTSYHVSIVEKVEGNIVWVYDGNSNNKVAYNCHALTASNIVGYANPNYGTAVHILDGYYVDTTSHWYECTICGYKVDHSSHKAGNTYYYDATHHWKICVECEIPIGKMAHLKVLDANGRYKCKVCSCAILEQMGMPETPITEEIV